MPPKTLHGVRSSDRTHRRQNYKEEEDRKDVYNEKDIKVNIPRSFDFSKKECWSTWVAHWNRYRRVSGLINRSDDVQIDMFLYCLGEEAEDVFSSFCLDLDNISYDLVLTKFEQYFEPKINVIYERAKFNSRFQNEEESVDEFVTVLHKLASSCRFGELKDELIRDRIVVGLRDPRVSEKLQLDSELTKEKAVRVAKNHELVREHQKIVRKELNKDESLELNVVSSNSQFRRRASWNDRLYRPVGNREKKNYPVNQQSDICSRCGLNHRQKGTCPARGSRCRACLQVGHWARLCRNRILNNIDTEQVREDGSENRYLSEVSGDSNDNPWRTEVKVDKIRINFKIDTGADVSVVPVRMADRIKREILSTKMKLYGPGEELIPVKGVIKVNMCWKGRSSVQDVYVADIKEPLLGRPALTSLKLVSLVQTVKACDSDNEKIIKKYPKLFDGLGRVSFDFRISLHENAKPYATATSRRIPFPLMDQVKNELDEMLKDGVISPVEEPTSWCSPLTIVPKPNGKLRLCVDYTQLNKAVKREYFILPTVEDSFCKIKNSKFFSKLDASKGYWQVPIENKSKLLTTFITPFGRFYFNRLPFGICSAPEFYQRILAQILEREEGTCHHIDDILVFGETKEEHDERLQRTLSKLEKSGVTLHKEKCVFGVTEVSFLGHVVGKDGIRADPEKVKVIKEFKEPTNVSELRRFLGMANYLLKFLPQFSTVTKPMRDLLVQENEWVWGEMQQNSFCEVKKLISTPPVLGHYNPNLRTRVSADSSSYGLGAVLEQLDNGGSWKPIMYASRTLTKTETNWAQIEKEALAITWACNKFDRWIYGLKFEIKTDHRPLVSILQTKPLSELSLRLQRMRMQMMRYDYSISYVPGKELYVPDTLSRNPSENEGEKENRIEQYVKYIRSSIPISDILIEKIKEAQSVCEVCRKIREYVKNGWPDNRRMSQELKEFRSYCSEISYVEGLIVKNDRIFIPPALKADILKRLHEGHLGITKCQRKASYSVWWPKINLDIQKLVEDCEECIKERRNPVEPMVTSELPEGPWQKVAADIFTLDRRNYLCLQDYFSRYPEVISLDRMSTSHIVAKVKSVFARFGIPLVFRCDQGTPFVSEEFYRFASEYGFKVISSSPKYPRSNGLAESGVKSMKHILKKNKEGDIFLGLLAYRCTPLESGFSPAELLMGRKLRSRVPMLPKKLNPQWPDEKTAKEREKRIKERQKRNYDNRHGVRTLRELSIGERVWITDLRQFGQVIRKADQPRSYIVEGSSGRHLKRNRTHLLPASQKRELYCYC